MKTIEAMKFSKSSVLKVIDELRDRTNESWDKMIALAEGDPDFLAHIEANSKDLTSAEGFKDPKHHRFASIMALVRYLQEFAEDQGDIEHFKLTTRALIIKKDDLEAIMARILPTINSTLDTPSDDKDDKDDAEDLW